MRKNYTELCMCVCVVVVVNGPCTQQTSIELF